MSSRSSYITYVLFEVGTFTLSASLIGFWLSVLLFFGGAIVGVALLKRVSQSTEKNKAIDEDIWQIASALLMIVPGLSTSVLALLLMIRPFRKIVLRFTLQYISGLLRKVKAEKLYTSYYTTNDVRNLKGGPIIELKHFEIVAKATESTNK